MDYQKIYEDFIADRRTKEKALLDGGAYFEKHHIQPKKLGGLDTPENLICLSLLDHIHAHILLGKIYGGAMWGAVFLMTKTSVGRNSKKRIPTKQELQKIVFAKLMHKKHIAESGGVMKGQKHSEETLRKMSEIGKQKAKQNLLWMQNNVEKISGDNHWTRKPENKKLAKDIAIENFKKASLANMGANNPMHKPEVKEKLSKIQKLHLANKTGAHSAEAVAKRLAKQQTKEYREKISSRTTGKNNPMYGKSMADNPNSRKVLCVETGIVFNSVKEAILFCRGDVTKACRTGSKAGGYHWKRIDQHKTDGRNTKLEAA